VLIRDYKENVVLLNMAVFVFLLVTLSNNVQCQGDASFLLKEKGWFCTLKIREQLANFMEGLDAILNSFLIFI
jgi:hypothetical protein